MQRLALLIVVTASMVGTASVVAQPPLAEPPVSTFSIVAYDPDAKEWGVAVQSRFLGVGAVVPWAKAGVGAIATQSWANTTFGPRGLQLLEQGLSAQEVMDRLLDEDPGKERRQVGIVDAKGNVATFTGDRCMDWAGGRTGKNYCVQGNILAGQEVAAAMAAGFEKAQGDLGDRLIASLAAGQAAGGDRRGRQSASLLVVKEKGGYGGYNDRYRDVRVDDHETPIVELKRVYALHKRTFRQRGAGGRRSARIDALRKSVWDGIAKEEEDLVKLSDAIWRHAETSLEETRSAAELAGYLERSGFSIERGVADMPTAFVASWGQGEPVIGILGEFDALPGISNKAAAERTPLVEGAPGHGCGHNLFGVAAAGAAVAAKRAMQAESVGGTIKFFGCPAEETVIGKVYMAKAGVFDGLSVCLDWHPGTWTGVDFSRTRAMNNFTVEFFGKTAHGAGDPWNGRSALDAVELMNHAVNQLREHVKPSTRIHCVIPDGGGAPNVVPGYAKVWYYVRDLERAGVESTYARVLKTAKAAAIATETTHKVTLTTGVHSYLLNRPLTELLDRNLRAAGAPTWTDQEQAFAKAIQKATGKDTKGMFDGIRKMPKEELPARGGSTDVAEVSRIVPTAKLRVASAPQAAPWHAWPVVACGGMSIGHKAMVCAARTLGGAITELAVSPRVVESAKREFLRKTKGKPYQSPIPANQKPPVK